MMRRLIVIGGGEHARVVIEAARSAPDAWEVVGFVDPLPCAPTVERLGVPRLGDDAAALAQAADHWMVLGVGTIGVRRVRQDVVGRYRAAGARWATVVHAGARVSPSARLGEGTVVMAGACVNACAVIGNHCVINTGAIVEHDVEVGSFAQLAPASAVGGGCLVGAGSYLGLGCRVRDHIAVGQGVTVGMGAVVLQPVPDGAVVVGVPARPRREGEGA